MMRQGIARAISSLEYLDVHPRWQRALPRLALAIGVVWVAACGAYLGVRSGGDTPRYVGQMERLRDGVISLKDVYRTLPLYHTTYTLMALAGGPQRFVWLVAGLTIFLPLLAVGILRQCRVGVVSSLAALAYLAANPEIYKWAWYILTDGLFFVEVLAVIYLVTRPRYSWGLMLGFVILMHLFLFTRPTSIVLLPGLLLYGLVARTGRERTFLTLVVVLAAVLFGWVLTSMKTEWDASQILHQFFTRGDLLVAPPQPVAPLTRPFSPDEAQALSIPELCGRYPGYCAEYYGKKLLAFLLPVHEWFSPRHRAFNLLFYGMLLLETAVSSAMLVWLVLRRHRAIAAVPRAQWGGWLLLGVTMVSTVILHMVTHVDPEARLLTAWVPVWICWIALQTDIVLRCAKAADA